MHKAMYESHVALLNEAKSSVLRIDKLANDRELLIQALEAVIVLWEHGELMADATAARYRKLIKGMHFDYPTEQEITAANKLESVSAACWQVRAERDAYKRAYDQCLMERMTDNTEIRSQLATAKQEITDLSDRLGVCSAQLVIAAGGNEMDKTDDAPLSGPEHPWPSCPECPKEQQHGRSHGLCPYHARSKPMIHLSEVGDRASGNYKEERGGK